MSKPNHDNLKKLLSVKFGWICWYCGLDITFREKHLDHIVPKSKGGTYDTDNLALTCGFCNRAKLDHELDELLSYLNHVRNNDFKPKIDLNGVHPLSSLWQEP